jgi:hypothetical protein
MYQVINENNAMPTYGECVNDDEVNEAADYILLPDDGFTPGWAVQKPPTAQSSSQDLENDNRNAAIDTHSGRLTIVSL